MSDHAQLARTGAGAVIVVGGVALTGAWLLTIALGLAVVGAVAIRFSFRRGRSAGQR